MEAAWRFGIFIAIFGIVAIWEILAQRRALSEAKGRRWAINLGIILTDILIQRVTLGALAFAAALYAESRGWGLFHALDWPFAVEAVIAFLILDLAIYLQHVMSHALPAFWRLHQVHHADLDVDVTTALRFHPVEILISLVYKALVVLAFGIDPWVVLVFEAVLNGSALFTHGNIRLPARADAMMRWVFCTPDMHRVHHSINPVETNSNFGNFLSIWDRLLGTMRQQPKLGHDGVVLGVDYEREPEKLGFLRLMYLPFARKPGRYSFDKEGDAAVEKAAILVD